MAEKQIDALAVRLLEACKSRNIMLCTAESCTGGLIAAALTEVPGSSAVVERGFITYSNAAKCDLLAVEPALIEAHGAVSEPVARAMAEGALTAARASAPEVALALSVTGVAGPGGTEAKPEGRVHFAAALSGAETVHLMCDFGPLGRGVVRRESVAKALKLGLDALQA